MRRSLAAFGLYLAFVSVAFSGPPGPVLGDKYITVKLDYFCFNSSHFDNVQENDGVYFGLEFFWKYRPQWYLGGEIGQGTNIGLISDEEAYLYPFELNIEYVKPLSSGLVLSAGIGPSVNYVQVHKLNWIEENLDADAVLLGGQVFCDLMVTHHRFIGGMNVKYQATSEMEETAGRYNNIRIGIQFGRMF